jgi:uncharacterized protein (TIGR02246 family)
MRRDFAALVGAAVLFAGSLVWAGQETSEDTNALDRALEAWIAAHNAHDSKALAALYTDDADGMFADGRRVNGRAEIEKAWAEVFEKNPKVRTNQAVISRRFLKPDVVVEDGKWEDSGHTEDGLPTRGFYVAVLVKQGGKWMLACDRGIVPSGTAPTRDDAASDRTKLRDALLERERASWEMTKKQDIAGLRDFYPDDFVEIMGDGTRLAKAELLEVLPDFEIQSYSLGESADLVQPSPDVATLVFTVTVRSRIGDGEPRTSTMLATSTYVRRDGRWRNVLYQETPAGSPETK